MRIQAPNFLMGFKSIYVHLTFYRIVWDSILLLATGLDGIAENPFL